MKNNESLQISALSSLALLKEDMDSGQRDYTDYLRAFVEHAIAKHAVDPINSETVAVALVNEFGLSLPDKVVLLVLQRMARDGVLTKQGGLFSQVPGKLGRHQEFDQRRSMLGQGVQALVDDFLKFLSLRGLPVGQQDALDAIFGFLDQFEISYLRAYLFRTALPDFSAVNDRIFVLFSEFIRESQESGFETFERLITLVKGRMYVNAFLCPDLDGIKKNFRLTSFYFDTPLVLHLLGHHGAEQERSAKELVRQLKKLGGKVCIFTHTFHEVVNVVKNAANWVDRPDGRGHVIRNARAKKLTRTDLLLEAERIEERLHEVGLTLMNNPEFDEQYQIAELHFQEALDERIEYYNDMAMRADVESVRSIYVIRGKTVPMRLEDALAVVVTTNSSYARAAYEFGRDHNSTREVSPVITDFSIANIAWLKSPLEWGSLAEVETLAACYAALEPRSADWRRYLGVIDSLANKGEIGPDEHALLRLSPVTRLDISQLTEGVSDQALVGGSVRDILDRIHSDIVAPTRSQLDSVYGELRDVQTQRETESRELHREKTALEALVNFLANAAVNLLLVVPLSIVLLVGFGLGSGVFVRFGYSIDTSGLLYWLVVVMVSIATLSTMTGFTFAGAIQRAKSFIAFKLRGWVRKKGVE